jgi:hypothetical protein
MSEPEVLEHEVPFPTALRAVLCSIGAFVAFMVTYELGGGVWPLNASSPFFAMFIIAGWGGAFAAIDAGLGTSQKRLVFRSGALEVTESWITRTRQIRHDAADIASIECREQTDSDGPNKHFMEIATRTNEIYRSRIFDTEATAKRHAAEFKRVLGL